VLTGQNERLPYIPDIAADTGVVATVAALSNTRQTGMLLVALSNCLGHMF